MVQLQNQGGWTKTLERYSSMELSSFTRNSPAQADQCADGSGTLLDLEFLVENGRRVAAFGFNAGFCGILILDYRHGIRI